MITNSPARTLGRIRFALSCVFLLAIVGLELHLGFQMVAGLGQATIVQTEGCLRPNMTLDNLMVSVR